MDSIISKCYFNVISEILGKSLKASLIITDPLVIL